MSRTYIYIDGFNFYYGAVKDTANKWLDFMAMCKGLLGPNYDILKIKYFTAKVNPTQHDPQKHIRQQTYLRALEAHIPEIEIWYGHFSTHDKPRYLVNPRPPKYKERVWVTEEKGSDVNLALQFLNDAWLDRYDCGVIISNDSDLKESVRLVKRYRKKRVIIINPQTEFSPSIQLSRFSHSSKTIVKSDLANYQLPNPIPGTKLYKPTEW